MGFAPIALEKLKLETTAPAQARFFVTGGTLHPASPSYIRRAADEDLFANLCRGEFCYVLNARQMGKSSLMASTAARLRRDGVGVVLIDLTAIGLNVSIEQWYYGMASNLANQAGLSEELAEFWETHAQLGPQQRWNRLLSELLLRVHVGSVVVFIDEIDLVRSLPFRTDEFFAGIRELFNRRSANPELNRLTFCLLGVTTPAELIEDSATTPFNIGVRVSLDDFTFEETLQLGAGLNHGRDAYMLLRRVFYWTDGHPYLTQRVCKAISERPNVVDAQEVDRVCGELFLSQGGRDRDDNLLFVRDRLRDRTEPGAPILHAYWNVLRHKRKPESAGSPAVLATLALSGAVKVQDGFIVVRNRLYRRVFDKRWLLDSLPDAEQRRAKRAYWKGFARASSLAAGFFVLAYAFVYGYTQRRLVVLSASRLNAEKGLADEASYESGISAADRYLNSVPPELGRVNKMLNALLEKYPGHCGMEWSLLRRASNPLYRSIRSEGPVASVFSPDPNHLASFEVVSKTEADLVVRDFRTAEITDRLALPGIGFDPHAAGLNRVLFRTDKGIQLWDYKVKKELKTFGIPPGQEPSGLDVSSDLGLLVASTLDERGASGETLRLFDLSTGRALRSEFFPHSVLGFGFQPHTHNVFFSQGGDVFRMSVNGQISHVLTLDPIAGVVMGLAFGRDTGIMAVNGSSGLTQFVDMHVGLTVRRLETGTCRNSLGIFLSSDGKYLALYPDSGQVEVWDVATGQCHAFPVVTIKPICLLPYDLVAVGLSDRTAIWDPYRQDRAVLLQPRQNSVAIPIDLDFFHNGESLVARSPAEPLRQWDLGTREEEETGPSGTFDAVARSGGAEANIRNDQGELHFRMNSGGWTIRSAPLCMVDVSSNSRLAMALTRDDDLILYDLARKTKVGSISRVVKACISSDGAEAAVITWPESDSLGIHKLHNPTRVPVMGGSEVDLWKDGRWSVIARSQNPAAFGGIAFDPGSQSLAVADNGTLDRSVPMFRFYDASSVRSTRSVPDPVMQTARFTFITYTPDGTRILTATNNGKIQIRDPKTLRVLLELQRPNPMSETDPRFRPKVMLRDAKGVQEVCCSPDSSSFAVSGWDGTVTLWRGDPLPSLATVQN